MRAGGCTAAQHGECDQRVPGALREGDGGDAGDVGFDRAERISDDAQCRDPDAPDAGGMRPAARAVTQAQRPRQDRQARGDQAEPGQRLVEREGERHHRIGAFGM